MIRPLRVVALDPSTAATAIASTHDPFGAPFRSVFTVPGTAKRPLHEQISIIELKVRRVCGHGVPLDIRYGAPEKPDLVTIEGTFSRKGSSDYPLHVLHGNIKQWLWRKGIPYVDVSPATLKMWATGSGSARGATKVTKRQVVEQIIAAYGRHIAINPADDNQADAVALLTMALAAYGQALAPPPSPRHERALKSQAWPDLEGT